MQRPPSLLTRDESIKVINLKMAEPLVVSGPPHFSCKLGINVFTLTRYL